jgi:hypothetical protein
MIGRMVRAREERALSPQKSTVRRSAQVIQVIEYEGAEKAQHVE